LTGKWNPQICLSDQRLKKIENNFQLYPKKKKNENERVVSKITAKDNNKSS